jgi:hypothetical protein
MSAQPFRMICHEEPIATGNHIDGLWFKLHPKRRLRAREPLPGELAEMAKMGGIDADTASKVRRLRCVIVGLIRCGIRVRAPLPLPPDVEVSALQAFSDEELIELLGAAIDNPAARLIVRELREGARAAVPFSERLAAQRRRKGGNADVGT